jgi:hypothetical protein
MIAILRNREQRQSPEWPNAREEARGAVRRIRERAEQ